MINIGIAIIASVAIASQAFVGAFSDVNSALAASERSSGLGQRFRVDSNPPWVRAAVIEDVTPEKGPVDTIVTVTGERFSEGSAVRLGAGVIHDTEVSADGTMLTFTIPEYMSKYCLPWIPCKEIAFKVEPGDYSVRVQNGYRTSNAKTFEVTKATTTEPISIKAIDGPASLILGEEGTWTVDVESEATGTLKYAVKWGDEADDLANLLGLSETVLQTSATFTHTYTEAGTYYPEFTVTDSLGNTVSKVAPRVIVAPENVPYIDSISPEKGLPGASVTIMGARFNSTSTLMIGDQKVDEVDIISDSEATFVVPKLAAGTYDVAIVNGDEESNTVSFTIEEPIPGKVSISGISAPNKLGVAEVGTWTVDAESNLSGNLKYSVEWGDTDLLGGRLSAETSVQSSATFTHVYSSEGTYSPVFTVTDSEGNSATVSATVVVE